MFFILIFSIKGRNAHGLIKKYKLQDHRDFYNLTFLLVCYNESHEAPMPTLRIAFHNIPPKLLYLLHLAFSFLLFHHFSMIIDFIYKLSYIYIYLKTCPGICQVNAGFLYTLSPTANRGSTPFINSENMVQWWYHGLKYMRTHFKIKYGVTLVDIP